MFLFILFFFSFNWRQKESSLSHLSFLSFLHKVPMSPMSWSKGKGQTIAAHEVSQIPLSRSNIVQHAMTFNIIKCHIVSQYVTIYCHNSVTMCHNVSQCVTMCHNVSPSTIIHYKHLPALLVEFHIWHARKPDPAFHDEMMNSFAHQQLGGELWAAILCGNITNVHVGSATWQLKVCGLWKMSWSQTPM